MPSGKGTYGSKRGRPKKETSYEKWLGVYNKKSSNKGRKFKK